MHYCLCSNHVLLTSSKICKLIGFAQEDAVRRREKWEFQNKVNMCICSCFSPCIITSETDSLCTTVYIYDEREREIWPSKWLIKRLHTFYLPIPRPIQIKRLTVFDENTKRIDTKWRKAITNSLSDNTGFGTEALLHTCILYFAKWTGHTGAIEKPKVSYI